MHNAALLREIAAANSTASFLLVNAPMPSQDEIENQQSLLAIHRRTLRYNLERIARLSAAEVLPSLRFDIDEGRASIQRIKALLRSWNIAVEDLPDDQEPDTAGSSRRPPPDPPAPALRPSRPSPSTTPADTFKERLTNLGFQHDPFVYPQAENMPAASLEETFVEHSGFFEHVTDLERSTVLLAAPGSGKTAGRLRLEIHLHQIRQQRLAEQIEAEDLADVPLVVSYNHFERLLPLREPITLEHHTKPLLGAIATSAYSVIEAAPQPFMRREQVARDWWWAFLHAYLQGEELDYRLPRSSALFEDWQRKPNRQPPFRDDTTLLDKLEVIQRRLVDLGVLRLCILLDGLDGHLETRSLANMAGIVDMILSTLPLLSMSWMLWKFFLPNVLADTVQQSRGRQTDRFQVVSISWDTESLRDFLRLRLKWASEGLIEDIERICDQDLLKIIRVEDELIALALRHKWLGPPRALLNFGNRLLHVMQSERLSLGDWEKFHARIAADVNAPE